MEEGGGIVRRDVTLFVAFVLAIVVAIFPRFISTTDLLLFLHFFIKELAFLVEVFLL